MAGPGQHVPLGAIVFISIIGGMLVILLLFCMYLNKMACFASCGGCDCFEEKKESKKKEKKSQLGESFGYEDDDSSSDSDNEMLLRYEHFASSKSSGMTKARSGGLMNGKGEERPRADPMFETEDERRPRISVVQQSLYN